MTGGIELLEKRFPQEVKAMPADIYKKAGELSVQGVSFAVATVVRVEGSTSAKPGAKAIIDATGKIVAGWVGGGCAETAVRSEAQKCIAQGKSEIITLDMMDEVLGVGMPCGGLMDVFIEPVIPKATLFILGHGRIAETLAELGHQMNFSVTVNDSTASQDKFPHADKLVTDDMDFSACEVTPLTYVVIATQHKGDHLWLQKALQGNAAYIGLVASRKRSRLVLDYALAEGVPAEKLDRVSAPAGLDLGALTPEEIALSIISEIVALRRGKHGQPLRQRAGEEIEGNSSSDRRGEASGKVISHCES
jgi:xanthine dehydrogenase accessory factor